jgi:hypothetical protein
MRQPECFVLDRGVAGFESYDADERSLGLFDTRHRAISAVREFQWTPAARG